MAIYNKKLEDITYDVIDDLQKQLKDANKRFLIMTFVASFLFAAGVVASIVRGNKIANYEKTILEQEDTIDNMRYILDRENHEISLFEFADIYKIYPQEEINDSTLYSLLVEIGAWYPELLVKQAKLESANYQSSVYTNNNNLYGMRNVYSRPTTQINTKNGYGVYHNWQLSAIDRVLWDEEIFDSQPETEDEYLDFIAAIYAEDPNYISKVKSIKIEVK